MQKPTLTFSATKYSPHQGSQEHKKSLVHITVKSPESATRTPSILICVIDVSGSMSEDASLITPSGENHGFSRLDLVKHSVNTLIHTLNENDSLALISFSDDYNVLFPINNMTAANKARAKIILDSLRPGGMTNLWAGLQAGLELMKDKLCIDQNVVLLLLTDGNPTVFPPKGYLPELQHYIKTSHAGQKLPGTIYTFGFGFQLDSKLLFDLAKEGSGTFSFIPDASMVGTIFINFLSHVLSTAFKKAELVLKVYPEKLGNAEVVGYTEVNSKQINGGSIMQIDLGPIEYQQDRNIIVEYLRFPQGPEGSLFLEVGVKGSKETKVDYEIKVTNSNLQTLNDTETIVHYFRSSFSKKVMVWINKIAESTPPYSNEMMTEVQNELKSFIDLIKKSPVENDERIQALLEDLQGQVTEAFSKSDWCKRWGIHFLRSISRAHLLQMCNNFKDPGVQHYGGKLFKELQDVANEIFCQLPPPTPSSRAKNSYNSNSNSSSSAAPISSMSVYYDSGNVCFEGECLVELLDGRFKKVKDILKGELVKTTNGGHAKVLCVIKNIIRSWIELAVFEETGLKITAWHPVRINNSWIFPKDYIENNNNNVRLEKFYGDYVYNFVLDEGHIMIINNIECVTLGHSFVDNDVVKHPYFGSPLVIEDLKRFRGWNDGLVEIDSACITRNIISGLICSLQPITTATTSFPSSLDYDATLPQQIYPSIIAPVI